MDAKITKKRLSHMLSYDWLKIIGATVAGILVWSLIFTMTATRIRASQKFVIFNYTSNESFNATNFFDFYGDVLDKGVFSDEVIETEYCDLAATPDMAGTLLETRLAVSECHAMFIANTQDDSTETTKENGEKEYKTYLESFSQGGFSSYMMDLSLTSETGYFKSMENYLSKFYSDWKDEATFDEGAVRAEFLARAEKNKDKRFKTAEEKEKGATEDIARIEKYRDALEDFYDYLDKGYIAITKTEVPSLYDEEWTIERYTIDLCPDENTMGDLKKIVNYPVTYLNEKGEEAVKYTAKNMNIALFNLEEVEDGFQYESLLFVTYLVQTYCTAL